MHWFVSTRSRTCVARVCGTLNERMIRSGARGRGTTAGKASAGLVKITAEVGVLAAVDRPARLAGEDLELAQRRVAVLGARVAAGIGREARTQHRADRDPADLVPGRLGSSLTVTCLPATGDPSEAQFVASVSSISSPG